MRVTPKVPSEPVPALQNRLRGEAVTPGPLGMSGGRPRDRKNLRQEGSSPSDRHHKVQPLGDDVTVIEKPFWRRKGESQSEEQEARQKLGENMEAGE